jgi:hypothetical protein
MIPIDELGWSQQLFGGSELGDARRTARLVDVGTDATICDGRTAHRNRLKTVGKKTCPPLYDQIQ